MKIKLLLLIAVSCIFIALHGCTKREITEIKPINFPPPVTDTLQHAGVFTVSNVLGSNMVIQRDKPFRIWGTATPDYKVTVTVSWSASTFSSVTDGTGHWEVSIPPAPANANPQTIVSSVNGLPAITFSNVLIGDVWICSGQSNMVMPVDSVGPFYGFEGVINYQAEIAAANYPQIRAMTVADDFENNPLDTLKKDVKWSVCSPTTAGTYSAISYFFARKLNTTLNVPIGILVSAVSGTYCEAWTSREAIQADPLLSAYYTKNGVNQLFNGMIHPLLKLSVKGFIWDQGESNRDDSPISNYTALTSTMITDWRVLFNQGQLPFYFVQMTPFARNFFNTNPWGDDPTADDYAKFREAQTNIRTNVAHTGEAITLDIDDIIRIHPKNKKPIGERLALIALKNDYSKPVQSLGPQYLSYTVNNDVATISYVTGTADGLGTINNGTLNQFFFVAGTDHVFRKGAAVISGNQVIVTAPVGTPLPIQAVRYAFTNFMVTNLQNSAGLPAEPFRTDNWSN